MAQTAQQINWDMAPAVPIAVLQMVAKGQTPAGQIITGPMGQQTYQGPIRERSVSIGDWRDNLKETPDK